MKTTLLAALAAIALPAAAFAQDIEVSDAYARSANPKSGAAFMMIRNTGASDCTLSAVSTDIAERVELHAHVDAGDGVMKMTQIEGGIAIPAGTEHALVRGGDHIMLMGLNAPLENGQQVALALDLGACGKVDVTMPVDNDRKPAAAPMDHGKAAGAAHGTKAH